jgi:hypothetical protein
VAFKEVADRYEIARNKYRNREIDHSEFLAARKEYDQAQKDFDVAFAVEQKIKPTPKGEFKNSDFEGFSARETFHPAYLLRNPNHKYDVWDDVRQVSQLLENIP